MFLVCMVVLVATTAAFVAYGVLRFKTQLARHISTVAAVVADNSAAALVFDNKPNAEQILGALAAEPDIVAAVLYDQRGRLFAKYPASLEAPLLAEETGRKDHEFKEGALVLFQPVIWERKVIGTLHVRSSLAGLRQQLLRYGTIMSVVFLGSLGAAFVLSTLLQKRITDPILALTSTAQTVSQRGDYSVRAPKTTEDELGTLADAFNRMLAETQEQQGRLLEQAGLLDLSTDAIFARDLQDRITYWNKGAEAAYGFTRGEAMGKIPHALLHTEFPEPLPAIEERLHRDGRWAGQLIHARKDGSRLISSSRWSLDRDARGKPVSVLETNTDITEEKQAAENLRASEERLRLAQQVARIGTFEWNIQTGENRWSRELESMYGLPPGGFQATQLAWEQLIHPDDRAEAVRRVNEALEHGSFEGEWRVVWPDGSVHWLAGRARVFRDEAGQPLKLLGVNTDITEKKLFEANLERLVAERTARLQETVGELEAFSYSISHDMRAPLRAMQGYSQALLEDCKGKLDAEAMDHLTRISRAAHRLDSLIRDVLAYSKVAQGDIALHPVDLGPLIEDVLANHPDFQPPQARVVVEPPLHRVLGHEAYLTQCVTNLLSNAVKFVPAGVTPEIHIRTERVEDGVRVWFEDNGIGIDPSHKERIFQIFGQVYPEKKYGGTGIGLAIVRKAAQRMGGEAGVESQLDKGSRFWLNLRQPEA